MQIIKKAGDVLAMKVVRAVLTQENGGPSLTNHTMNGSATLPHRKPQQEESKWRAPVSCVSSSAMFTTTGSMLQAPVW